MIKPTYDEWRSIHQAKIDGMPKYQCGIPMTFGISNHLGFGMILMSTGHIGQEPITGIWIAALHDTFSVFNQYATDDDPAPYHVVVEYHIGGLPRTSGEAESIHLPAPNTDVLIDLPPFPSEDVT